MWKRIYINLIKSNKLERFFVIWRGRTNIRSKNEKFRCVNFRFDQLTRTSSANNHLDYQHQKERC